MDSLLATFILSFHWAKSPDIVLPRSWPTQKYILNLEMLLLELPPEHNSTQMSYACRLFSMFTVLQFKWPSWVYDYCCLPVWAATCMRKWLSIIVGGPRTAFSLLYSLQTGYSHALGNIFVKSLLKCCVSFHLLKLQYSPETHSIYIYRRRKIWYLLQHALVF